ncbi:hypothetical protein BABINDRAFT_163585 [Babjeviella inositovora NRRL Y-12698]|uniref:SEC7 domain-containing protein n=1 Tax=Babjeviella inositovora NRRL Y-12698 TaxID=984486 RepID=A0A1E3QHZ9_9ASCO|nr:uncharacterized protein BABINDRAFT_163585 [Babjeviella inositovora NRRL Y-12698]ODQ77325.1 hypothetical protein BABINDRAFT_163585 [Babjeviella inositovora NRRL Y-12698]
MVPEERKIRHKGSFLALRQKLKPKGVFADITPQKTRQKPPRNLSDSLRRPTFLKSESDTPSKPLARKISQLFDRSLSAPVTVLERESTFETISSGKVLSERPSFASNTSVDSKSYLEVSLAAEPLVMPRHRSRTVSFGASIDPDSLKTRSLSIVSLNVLSSLGNMLRSSRPSAELSPSVSPAQPDAAPIRAADFPHGEAYLACLESIYDDFPGVHAKSSRQILAVLAHEITEIGRTTKSALEREMVVEAFRSFLIKNFDFYQVPLDIALRLLLARYNLPGETGEIDFFVTEFARNWYHTNNTDDPDIQPVFGSQDQIYILSFGMLILNTDHHNPNVKQLSRMTKHDFVSIVLNSLLSDPVPCNVTKEILEYFYDNITYKEFSMATPEGTGLSRYVKSVSPPVHGILLLLVSLIDVNLKVEFEVDYVNPFPRAVPIDINNSMIFNYVYYLLTTETPPVQLRLSKNKSKWLNPRLDDPETTQYFTKVIRLGVVYKPVAPKLLRAIKLYGMLTTTGFYLFKPSQLLAMFEINQQQLDDLCVYFNAVGDAEQVTTLCDTQFPPILSEKTGYSVFDSGFTPHCSLSVNDLFATPDKGSSLESKKMFLVCGRSAEEMLYVQEEGEVGLWIDSINVISALDNVIIPLANVRDIPADSDIDTGSTCQEITGGRTMGVHEKTVRYCEMRSASMKILHERYLGILQFLSHHVFPLQMRTREMVMAHGQMIKLRIDMLWHEIHKSDIMIGILQQLKVLLDEPFPDAFDDTLVDDVSLGEDVALWTNELFLGEDSPKSRVNSVRGPDSPIIRENRRSQEKEACLVQESFQRLAPWDSPIVLERQDSKTQEPPTGIMLEPCQNVSSTSIVTIPAEFDNFSLHSSPIRNTLL